MPFANVTVGYVNPPKPGKKMGSIKTKDGAYYNVWPDKLAAFQAGGNYDIEYEVNDAGYMTFRRFSGDTVGQTVTHAAQAPLKAAAAGAAKSTAEEMFAMGFVNRLYQGACSCPPQGELTEAIRTARSSWRDAWAPPKPVIEAPFDDEIPF